MIAAALMQHSTVLAADGGLFDIAGGLTADAKTLALEGGSLVALIFVIKHLVESFTAVRLFVALMIGSVMIWGIYHMQELSDATDKTVKQHENAALIVPGPPQPDILRIGQV